ncbi:MAG: hypothetical protein RIT14_2073 [Pseudomonadota bacterium]|jgi:phosphatidylglycerophosphate synthase
MFDGVMRRVIDPPLNRAGRALAAQGIGADAVTLAGLALGLAAAGLIAAGGPAVWALLPLLLGRVADGLDGAVARAGRKSDFGGYLDIVCDFIFYAAIPLAFALRDPAADAAAAAFLLASFYVNGASFLGYAILAEKHGMESAARGEKSLYFTAGLLEGTETIALFVLFCLWPAGFAPLAWGFGALCLVTAGARVRLAWGVFGRPERTQQ